MSLTLPSYRITRFHLVDLTMSLDPWGVNAAGEHALRSEANVTPP